MAEEQPHQYFTGLDIGTTGVRCVVGEMVPGAVNPQIIGYAEAENSGLRRGNVARVDEVAQAIIDAVAEAERTSGRQIKAATVNVNGSHVEGLNSKGVIAISGANHEITTEDRRRVEEAATIVQLPANKDIIQVFAKNYRLDGQENIKDPVGMQGVRLEVDTHILLASSPALKSLHQALEKAEIAAAHRTVSSLAAAEIVLDRKQKEFGTCVLDIGAATTNLVVIEDGEVEHIAVIPMGGIHITNDLASVLRTEIDIAEIVKVKYANLAKPTRDEISLVHGGETHHFETRLMGEIIEARVEEILEFVDKELKKIHRSRKLPGGVTLVGGTAKLPGLVDFTKEVLELPARIGHWQQIKNIVGSLDEQPCAPAVGLMVLDMLLGEPEHHGLTDAQPGFLQGVGKPLNKLMGRFRR